MLGGRARAIRDYRSIEAALASNIHTACNKAAETWTPGEKVAYYTPDGECKLGEIIRPNLPHVLKRVELTTHGEPRTVEKIITIPQQGYNERGQAVKGSPVWKVRYAQVNPPHARGKHAQRQKQAEQQGHPPNRHEDKIEQILVFDGVMGIDYPRTANYEIELNDNTTEKYDNITVKQMTRSAVDKTTKRPTCENPNRWPVELQLPPQEKIDFPEVWDTFKIGIATPVDFGTRFRMIHGDLGTRSKLGEPGGCRLGCGCPTEKHIHLLRCRRLQPIWLKLVRLLERLRGKRFHDWRQAALLGWTKQEGKIEKGSVALMSMLLKIIVIEWYQVIRAQREFDYAKTWKIFWRRAKRQWDETARDKEYELRNIHQRKSDTRSTWKGISRQLHPIGDIDQHTCVVTCRINWTHHEEY
jgi:hypothetical protein